MAKAHSTKTHNSFVRNYKSFYEKFVLVTQKDGINPYNLEFNATDLTKNSWELTLKHPIYLSQWPVEDGVPYSKVDIAVQAIFQYEEVGMFHTRSSVYLTYFSRDTHKKTACPFENIRFDYHPDKDDKAHPLLHAHIFASKPPNSEPELLRKSFTINWKFLGTRLNDFRLPIPNMTLPSVLCCLVACHLGTDKLNDLLNKTKKERKLFPHLALSGDQTALLSGNSFAGSQWFERP